MLKNQTFRLVDTKTIQIYNKLKFCSELFFKICNDIFLFIHITYIIDIFF